MNTRTDRRTFVRSALTAGAGVLLAPTAAWSAAQKARLAEQYRKDYGRMLVVVAER